MQRQGRLGIQNSASSFEAPMRFEILVYRVCSTNGKLVALVLLTPTYHLLVKVADQMVL
jgi:hypothetical protein